MTTWLLSLAADSGAISITGTELTLGVLLVAALGALAGIGVAWGKLNKTVTDLEAIVARLGTDLSVLSTEIAEMRGERRAELRALQERGSRVQPTGRHAAIVEDDSE